MKLIETIKKMNQLNILINNESKQLCIDHNKTGIEAAQRIDLNGRNFVLVTQSKKLLDS